MDHLLYGVAYYDEYMPVDRLAEDIAMMQKAGINTVRIAESTWATCEPRDGEFDFSHVERVMDAMERAGIQVIIGTPTYAIPPWLVKKYPDVLAVTKNGRGIYGPRQIMDITHPGYLFHAERVIRKLMEVTAHRKCVIGFQLDNETKPYGTAGENAQKQFVQYLKERFHGDIGEMNRAFGLDYWSNRISDWEDFPDVRGTINGSLGGEFEAFQRSLVTKFLAWQADIVREYAREDQFITHNFDLEWRGYSYGIQPEVDHLQAARPLTIAGVDIYHPAQNQLTGTEIALGGDLTRSLKQDNYLVMETQAQGFPCWTPYPGQLRLQAFSHIASGASGISYWHWHSIHNSFETYWKGLLSHDFEENATYLESCIVGREFAAHSPRLTGLKKKNDVAILVSNRALTALNWFGIQATSGKNGNVFYNDIFRWIYDTLYRMNVECDILWPDAQDLDQYKVIILPALYAAPDELLEKLEGFTARGGCLISTFKTGFANEYCKVSHNLQPHLLTKVFGIHYHQFTFPENVTLSGIGEGTEAKTFMELLIPDTAETLASYIHPAWGRYAAITRNGYEKGRGYYLGTVTTPQILEKVLKQALSESGVAVPALRFPLILRTATNSAGKQIHFYLNYSPESHAFVCPTGIDILTGKAFTSGDTLTIGPWNLAIIETDCI